jgi:Na+-transporting methylmalonyl-CoA/oxaloacetate decarboxylase gamma subunit
MISAHLFAMIPDRPSFSELLEFQATGLVVVFGALAVLWILLELMGAFFRRQPGAVKPAPVVTAPPRVVPPGDEGLEAGVVAAIAAAVHITMKGQPHQITEIKLSDGNSNWAAEGRREIFSSHRVR